MCDEIKPGDVVKVSIFDRVDKGVFLVWRRDCALVLINGEIKKIAFATIELLEEECEE
jgi:hypothetical protein